ncbi:hypothetical protein G6F43_012185 [Rhizopus delemar]|nr:hypothetical protein G6F43_012185 [Rhizopus delemar]
MADIELKREQTIEYAEHFKDYELSLAKHQFDIEMSIAEDEYKSEKHNLHDVVLQAIEERRKLIKEDKEDVDIDDMFNDVHIRLANSKRNLRKRTHPFDRHLSASPSRQERRRQNRIQTLYNIHAAPSSLEQEGLEEDFLNMKGVSTSIRKQGGHVHSSNGVLKSKRYNYQADIFSSLGLLEEKRMVKQNKEGKDQMIHG